MTIFEVNELCADYWHRCLFTPAGKIAFEYLKKRGLSKAMIEKYRLGFAPDSFYQTSKYLKKQGVTEEEIIAAGLYSEKEKDGEKIYYDKFRNRVIFPIINGKGIVGFGGRVLDDSKPKYVNTRETKIFHKSFELFGINNVDTKDKIILCEGYMDAISISQAKCGAALAPLGTSFTTGQALLLNSFAKEVILCFDGDKAGQLAIDRAITVCKNAGVNFNLSIIKIPVEKAKDPDEFIKKFGRNAFKSLIDSRVDVFCYQMEKAKELPPDKCLKESISLISNHLFLQ